MKFERLPVEDTAGAVLAHSVRAGGTLLKKGRVLTDADARELAASGRTHVMVARLEASDIPEDQAAHRIARAVAGKHTSISPAFTGRVNVFAAADGLAIVDRQRLIALNGIDEAVTVATVAPYQRVAAGQLIATVKIITFAVAQATIEAVERMAASALPLFDIAHFSPHRAGLVLTRVDGTKPNVLEKRSKVMRDRLEAAGSRLSRVETVDHDADAVRDAIAGMAADGLDPVLVFGASAIVDRGDVVPAALVACGGRVVHLGMPVDPGNLLMLGRLQATDVIGVPSCAASPKINGFDWVLERCLAGLTLGREEIVAMAPGGLLAEIETRPQPRIGDRASPSTPKVAAIVLAAGRSTRMGGANKLHEEVAGKPILRHVVDAALASAASPVIVVTGHEGARTRRLLAGLDVVFVDNPAHRDGLSTSLTAGIRALGDDADAAIVLLADMPDVRATEIDRLIAAFDPKEGRVICVPVRDGRQGNPVVWGRQLFPEILEVKGDTGAKHLIATHAELVAEVPIDSEGIFGDIDTPEALAVRRRAKGGV